MLNHLGKRFELPDFFVARKPFPGPGLLVRMGNHNMVDSGRYALEDVAELGNIANRYSNKYSVSAFVTQLEAVGSSGDERAEGLMAFVKLDSNHEKSICRDINNLLYVAGQIPHYTTVSRQRCITKIMAPLFDFDAKNSPHSQK